MSIQKYLNKIHEQKIIKKNDRLKCTICSREVTVNKAGTGPLICCDKPMAIMGTVVEAGFRRLPKGWSQDSVKKFARTLSKNMKGGPKSEGWFDKCVEKMKGKVDNLKEQAYEQYQLMADKFLELHEYEDFILRKYSDDNIKELLMELDGILKQRWEDE